MVAVRYKYRDEPEAIIEDADRFTVSSFIDPLGATHFQPIGSYTNIPTGQKRPFIGLVYNFADNDFEFGDFSVVSIPYVVIREGQPDEVVQNKIFVLQHPSLPVPSTLYGAVMDYEDFIADNFSKPNQGEVYPGDLDNRTAIIEWTLQVKQRGTNQVILVNEPPIQVSSTPVIEFWNPTKGTRKYKFDVFSGESLVFSRTENLPPDIKQVITNDRECPVNTCPVKCGENVCCYGSDGIAIESFLFSESVYA